MKKFLAISASAVMALSVFAFSACTDNTDKGAENLTYTEVDLSTEEAKAEFLEELTTNINPEKLFGDTKAEGFSYGLASDVKLSAEVNATAKAVPVSETETKDLSAYVKVELGESLQYKFSEKDVLLSSKTNVKYNTNIADEIYALVALYLEMPEGSVETLKTVFASGDYTLNEYIDGEYLYVEYPESIVGLLPEEIQGFLPEGGKLKIAFSDLAGFGSGDNNDSYYSSTEDAYDEGMETVNMIEYIFNIIETCNVKIAVSKENGYALKVSADKDSIVKLIKQTPAAAYWAQVEQVATFNTCALTAYLAVDENGLFKEVTVKAELNATVNMVADLIMEGIPAINGSVKLSLEASVKSYDGTVNLPSDLDSFKKVEFPEGNEE